MTMERRNSHSGVLKNTAKDVSSVIQYFTVSGARAFETGVGIQN